MNCLWNLTLPIYLLLYVFLQTRGNFRIFVKVYRPTILEKLVASLCSCFTPLLPLYWFWEGEEVGDLYKVQLHRRSYYITLYVHEKNFVQLSMTWALPTLLHLKFGIFRKVYWFLSLLAQREMFLAEEATKAIFCNFIFSLARSYIPAKVGMRSVYNLPSPDPICGTILDMFVFLL